MKSIAIIPARMGSSRFLVANGKNTWYSNDRALLLSHTNVP